MASTMKRENHVLGKPKTKWGKPRTLGIVNEAVNGPAGTPMREYTCSQPRCEEIVKVTKEEIRNGKKFYCGEHS